MVFVKLWHRIIFHDLLHPTLKGLIFAELIFAELIFAELIFAELIFRGINFREFAIFGKFAESIFANFEKSAKPFFVIYLLFLPILQYFWEINNGIIFSRN